MADPATQVEAQISPDPEYHAAAHCLTGPPKRSNDRFADQPRVQAAIRFTIGWTYLSIGAYEKAEALFKEDFESRRRTLGQEHPDTLDSMDRLASAYS